MVHSKPRKSCCCASLSRSPRRAADDDTSLAPEKRLAGAPTLDRASEFVDELRRTAAARRGERLSEAQQQLFRGFEWTNPNVLLELDADVAG